MPREFSRSRRVGEQIQRELADLIQRELKDPRLGFVTVSGVEVSRDMAYAKVFVSVLGSEGDDVERNLQALTRAAGFLRRELGRRIKLRNTPELRFVYDESIERGARMDALIRRAVEHDRNDPESED